MRKLLTVLIVAALAAPAMVAAQTAPPPPPTPTQPTPPRTRQAPRVFAERIPEGREEQRETFTKTVRVGGNGLIDISNLSGNIEIRRGGGNDAVIEITKIARGRTPEAARELLPLVTVEINSRGERAEVRTNYATTTEHGPRRNINVSVNYNITVPQGTRVRAVTISGNLVASDVRGELSMITTSGNVNITNAGRVTAAKSTSGNVELGNIDSDVALEAGTISGNVTVRSAKARRMDLSTVTGVVIVQDVETERLAAQTLSGSLEFSGRLAKGGRYDLKSHSGNVILAVSGGSGFEVDANSWSGHVRSDFAIGGSETGQRGHRKVIRGVVGDGSAVVNITTFSGNVHLAKK